MRLALQAMGTRFELVLVADDVAHDARLRAVGEAALDEVREQHQKLSLFEPASLLSHVHRRAGEGWIELDLDTFELLEDAAAIWRASQGAFDPTVAPLMRALGLHGEHEADAQDIAAARAAVGMDAVELDPARRAVRFNRPGVALDLGGIAKGHALDLAVAVLREHGITSALLHGGTSTVVALGAPPDAEAWRVELAGSGGQKCALRDGVLAVSAPHGRNSASGGGHVLDPRSGTSASGVTLAAVAAPLTTGAARRADAWSTALVAGAREPANEFVWFVVRADGAHRHGRGRHTCARFEP